MTHTVLVGLITICTAVQILDDHEPWYVILTYKYAPHTLLYL